MGIKDSLAAARANSRQQKDARAAVYRHEAKRMKLRALGVPARGLADLPEEALDTMIADEKRRQSELYEMFIRSGGVTRFTALGVQILAGDDKVYTIGDHDSYEKSNSSRVLGPVAGAEARVTDSTSAFSPGKALLMPVALAPLARKETADALITFPDGTMRTRSLDGGQAVRDARRQAVQFNAIAGTAFTQVGRISDDPAAVLRKLQELLDAGLLTQAEYEAKRAEVISAI